MENYKKRLPYIYFLLKGNIPCLPHSESDFSSYLGKTSESENMLYSALPSTLPNTLLNNMITLSDKKTVEMEDIEMEDIEMEDIEAEDIDFDVSGENILKYIEEN